MMLRDQIVEELYVIFFQLDGARQRAMLLAARLLAVEIPPHIPITDIDFIFHAGLIVWLSEDVCARMGVDRIVAIGQRWIENVMPEDQNFVAQVYHAAMRHDNVRWIRLRLVNQDGTIFRMIHTLQRVGDVNPALIGRVLNVEIETVHRQWLFLPPLQQRDVIGQMNYGAEQKTRIGV